MFCSHWLCFLQTEIRWQAVFMTYCPTVIHYRFNSHKCKKTDFWLIYIPFSISDSTWTKPTVCLALPGFTITFWRCTCRFARALIAFVWGLCLADGNFILICSTAMHCKHQLISQLKQLLQILHHWRCYLLQPNISIKVKTENNQTIVIIRNDDNNTYHSIYCKL